MAPRSLIHNPTPVLLAFGIVAFGLAGLSIADMFVERPYDGVVLSADERDRLVVSEVIPDSGADRAGLVAGDKIIGIGRDMVRDARAAARALNKFRSGDEVPYFVKKPAGVEEIMVRQGRRRLGDGTYFYSSALGFAFFFIGLFVLVRQPTLRASQVFFLLCGLFMLFLVCRMRPASYSAVDPLLLTLGTVAFLLLPPAFLHFYLIFPRPAWLRMVEDRPRWRAVARLWQGFWPAFYLLPVVVYGGSYLLAWGRKVSVRTLNGAPLLNWWLLALFVLLGLAALTANYRCLKNPRERRGMALVLAGSFFGVTPFLISMLVAAHQYSQGSFFFFGVMPLALVPLTFTYAIVRFQLLDIRVILRRSLLYTVTTALVTGLYAGGIATFNALFRGTAVAESRSFPIVLALAIILLFDPFRRRVQEVIDRFFFAPRSGLEQAMVELGEAMTAKVDLQPVVTELVEKLPRVLGLRFAALYLERGGRLERAAGPRTLPEELPVVPELQRFLRRRARLTRLDQLGALPLRSGTVARVVERLTGVGVESIGELASPRRTIGWVLFSAKERQLPLERDEIELLQRLLHQAALALETSLLVEERTRQAELERELEIAATIQAQLLPGELEFAAGWEVAATCRPAQIVGGDFFAQLPAEDGSAAVIFGDVSGKSVSGALVMMAAHEALHTLAMTRPLPADLFTLANRRLYSLGKRSFVALGYFSAAVDGRGLRYLVAGQPPPLLRRSSGEVSELPLPEHRLPVGALADGEYRDLEIDLEPGDLVLGYSDGVTEARSPDGELFGDRRLQQIVAASGNPGRPGSAGRLVENVLAAVDGWSGGGIQSDDLTLVAVGRNRETDE